MDFNYESLYPEPYEAGNSQRTNFTYDPLGRQVTNVLGAEHEYSWPASADTGDRPLHANWAEYGNPPPRATPEPVAPLAAGFAYDLYGCLLRAVDVNPYNALVNMVYDAAPQADEPLIVATQPSDPDSSR
jgi:hypothetical protein